MDGVPARTLSSDSLSCLWFLTMAKYRSCILLKNFMQFMSLFVEELWIEEIFEKNTIVRDAF